MPRSSRALWPASVATRDTYGDIKQFFETFSPLKIASYTNTHDKCIRCVAGIAPSLAVLQNAYGAEAATLWVTQLLNYICSVTGRKVLVEQLTVIANSIIACYNHLKVTDLMLYSQLLIAGQLGSLYAQDNASALADALSNYLKVRESLLMEWARSESHKRSKAIRASYTNEGRSAEEVIKDPSTPKAVRAFLEHLTKGTPLTDYRDKEQSK